MHLPWIQIVGPHVSFGSRCSRTLWSFVASHVVSLVSHIRRTPTENFPKTFLCSRLRMWCFDFSSGWKKISSVSAIRCRSINERHEQEEKRRGREEERRRGEKQQEQQRRENNRDSGSHEFYRHIHIHQKWKPNRISPK